VFVHIFICGYQKAARSCTGIQEALIAFNIKCWCFRRFPGQIPIVMALGTLLVLASIALLVIAEYYRRRGLARTGQTDSGGFL